jgi:predicted MFS family arabinose efflux permease
MDRCLEIRSELKITHPTSAAQVPVKLVEVDQAFWSPLRNTLYRTFWIAAFFSNIGTWVHEVGSGWLMASLDASPEMVASVRTAMTLPVMLLAIPAGALADRIDRRRLLMTMQCLLCFATGLLSVLTATGWINAWGLLALTFLIGLCTVVHVPTWQASVPELVSRSELPRAIALGSISFNLARTIGPALGGALIAAIGVWSAFAFNAISFGGVLLVLTQWKRAHSESNRGLSFWMSTVHGVRYVTRDQEMRRVIVGILCFVIPASALWSLLPLVARDQLHWEAPGYGLLVASIGFGAVGTATILSSVVARIGKTHSITCGMALAALGIMLLSTSLSPTTALLATITMGSGWMISLTLLNTSAQVTLPRRLRARGMGCCLAAMSFSMSLGSTLWGRLAGATDLPTTFFTAAVVLLLAAALRIIIRQPTTKR